MAILCRAGARYVEAGGRHLPLRYLGAMRRKPPTHA
jgi:hypothetical protein